MDALVKSFHISIENIDLYFILHRDSFIQTFQPGFSKDFHNHLYYEVLFSLSGKNVFHYAEGSKEIPSNSITVIPPYAEHFVAVSESNSLFSIGFYYAKNKKNDFQTDLFTPFDTAIMKNSFFMMSAAEHLKQLFWQLAINNSESEDQILKNQAVQPTILAQLIFEIYFSSQRNDLITISAATKAFGKAKHKSSTRIPVAILYQINQTLTKEFMKDITPESLSQELFVMPHQINRYILNQYGCTFLQRRTFLRMRQAQKLLLKTDLTVSKIAAQVGYQSINTFYSAFKKHTGMTPDAYRQNRGK